jgi:UDP:flavonoid glycosyltransferase YjiC (YdhE family)
MRILFTTFAWPSHYFAQVPLAWACRAAGHEVRMTSQPELERVMLASGLPGVLVGHDLDVVGYHQRMERTPVVKMPPPPSEWDETRKARALKGFGMFVDLAFAMADDLIGYARDWRPDLIVFDPLSYAGPLTGRVLGIPAVRNLFGPDIALDLEYQALPRLLSHYGVADMSIYGALSIDPCPPSLQLESAAPRQFVRYVPYNGLTVVPSWVAEPPRRRRVCLTWGTSTTRLDPRYTSWLPDILSGLSQVDAEIVLAVTARELDLIDGLPANVRAASGVPLQTLLPTCEAVVHQGGAGTTLTSVLSGLPQVVVAQLADQLVTGRRVTEVGIGRCVLPTESVAGDIREAVEDVLAASTYRERAAAMRAEMLAQPAPLDVVPVLEAIARDGALVSKI